MLAEEKTLDEINDGLLQSRGAKTVLCVCGCVCVVWVGMWVVTICYVAAVCGGQIQQVSSEQKWARGAHPCPR